VINKGDRKIKRLTLPELFIPYQSIYICEL